MRKGVRLVRLLSWGDIYNDLMSRPNIEPDWGGWLVECGTLKREIFCPDAGYFVNESECGDHLVGSAGYPIPGDPATSEPWVETGLPRQPSPVPAVLGHFRFLQATLKSFGSPGGAGASGLHHGHMEQQK